MTQGLTIDYAKSGDHHLAFTTRGAGDVDVLRVGAWFSNLEQSQRMRERGLWIDLAAVGREIEFDALGTGLSDRIRSPRVPTAEERMDDMRAVLDAVGSERAVVVAFADAGALCSLFAATHPERTVALALCNTAPRTAWAPDYPWGPRPEEIESELAEIETRWGTRAFAEDLVRGQVPTGGAIDEWTVDWWVTTMRQAAGPGDAALLCRMYYELDARHVLPLIRVPTLVLSRGGSLAAESAAMVALIPGARHELMPGTARVVYLEEPERYVEAIGRFVGEVRTEEAELESALATVLFTDIVGSTAAQASWATGGGVSSLRSTIASFGAVWRGTEGGSSTRRATGSSRHLTGQRAASVAVGQSSSRCTG